MTKFTYDPTKNKSGAFISGVPNMDITAAAWSSMPAPLKTAVNKAPFFVKVKPASKTAAQVVTPLTKESEAK